MPGRQPKRGRGRGGGGGGGGNGGNRQQQYGNEVEKEEGWQKAPTNRKPFNKPTKPRHNMPPIEIAAAPVSKQERQRPPVPRNQRGGNTWQQEDGVQEMNAHLSEKLRNGRPGNSNEQTSRSNAGIPRNVLVEKFERESTAHLDGWRGKPEVPAAAELFGEEVELPVNLVDGPWADTEEYLESHFELLREDAFAPLRDAVGMMRADHTLDDTQDMCVYEDVRALGVTYARMGVCVKMSFSLNRARKRIKWAQSKRLNPGTLVALSCDKFQSTIKIATVAARPLAGLENNPPEVDILFNVNEIEIDPTKVWIMVEARSSYFEAYKHTLKGLQRMREENFPLCNHLVKLNKNIEPPQYLINKPVLDLNPAFPDHTDKEGLSSQDVLYNWPKGITTSMDDTQISALRRILTKKLAVVQGPPGTGKTFTSVLALDTMLRNMDYDDPPIVVACQTNHALDQLLRHVLEFETNVVRLGSRTQDKDKILKRTIYNKRQESNVNIQGSGFARARRELDSLQQQMCTLLESITEDFLSPKVLFEGAAITKPQMNSFENASNEWVKIQDDDKPNSPVATWLADYVMPMRINQDLYHEYEDEDIGAEELMEREAEFVGADGPDFDDTLKGGWFSLKRNFTVESPMGVTDEDVAEYIKVTNVWDIPEHIRPRMYLALERIIFKNALKKFLELNMRYQAKCKDLQIARMEKDAFILQRSKLVGLTTTGLSKYRSLVAAISPKILLIEEAAETLEGPIIVGCYPSVEHLILVGDHKQLRGHCSVYELEAEPYNLGVSMFERLVENKMPFTILSRQRRMRPEIREILNPIYSDLKDDAQVLNRPNIAGMGTQNVFFYTHTVQETNDELSKTNWHEAEMVVNMCDYLMLNGAESKDITILTFYSGQMRLILSKLRRNPHLRGENIRVATVDSYQGEENDIVLLSLVRSNSDGKIGFLGVENRVCVSLSRAQRGFYMFGNIQMLSQADKLWWDVGTILNRAPPKIGLALPLTCSRHRKVTSVTGIEDWIGLNGGCRDDCGELLPCKHKCHLKCHPFDHSEVQCREKCDKIMECGHKCDQDCSSECRCKQCAKAKAASEASGAVVSLTTKWQHTDAREDPRRRPNMAVAQNSKRGAPLHLSSERGKEVLDQMALNAEETRAKSGSIIDVEGWATGTSTKNVSGYEEKKYAMMHQSVPRADSSSDSQSIQGANISMKGPRPSVHSAKTSVPQREKKKNIEFEWDAPTTITDPNDQWGAKVDADLVKTWKWK